MSVSVGIYTPFKPKFRLVTCSYVTREIHIVIPFPLNKVCITRDKINLVINHPRSYHFYLLARVVSTDPMVPFVWLF
jgi:hypothetical protein